MAEFKNHRRFTLRCLSKGLIPVSIKLKTKVHTPKGNGILRKAERMLMNERVRNINNTIEKGGQKILLSIDIGKFYKLTL